MATTESPELLTPDQLIAKLPAATVDAGDDLLFFESTVSVHNECGIDFELTICPALLHKPPLPTPKFDTPQAPADPFAPPYSTGLLVGEIHGEEESDYIVLLNKYSVVKEHFLLVTKEFQSQTTPPTPADLVASYQILFASQRAGRPLFAFFNCGDRSGASQRHKHLQFIAPINGGPPAEKLARAQRIEEEASPFALPNVSYAHYVRRLPTHLSSASPSVLYEELMSTFLSLLDLAILAIRHDPASEDHPSGPPSYNVLLTTSHMHIIPRAKEQYALGASTNVALPSPNQNTISINALGFAGMLLVKSGEFADNVRNEGIVTILRGVGIQKLDENFKEAHNEEVGELA